MIFDTSSPSETSGQCTPQSFRADTVSPLDAKKGLSSQGAHAVLLEGMQMKLGRRAHRRRRSSSASSASLAPLHRTHRNASVSSERKIRIVGRFASPQRSSVAGYHSGESEDGDESESCLADDERDGGASDVEMAKRGRSRRERKVYASAGARELGL